MHAMLPQATLWQPCTSPGAHHTSGIMQTARPGARTVHQIPQNLSCAGGVSPVPHSHAQPCQQHGLQQAPPGVHMPGRRLCRLSSGAELLVFSFVVPACSPQCMTLSAPKLPTDLQFMCTDCKFVANWARSMGCTGIAEAASGLSSLSS